MTINVDLTYLQKIHDQLGYVVINSETNSIIKSEGDMANNEENSLAQFSKIIRAGLAEQLVPGETFHEIVIFYPAYRYTLIQSNQNYIIVKSKGGTASSQKNS